MPSRPIPSPQHQAMIANTEIDIDSDLASDTTLDSDDWSSYLFGEPLTRMVRFEYLSSPSVQDSEDEAIEEPPPYFVRDEEINFVEDDMSLFDLALRSREDTHDDPLLRPTSQAYAHYVIDHLAANVNASSAPRLCLHAAQSHPSHPLLIRRLPSTSTHARELALWRYLNSPCSRRDPWNPAPPALSIVERELPASALNRLAHIVEFGSEAENSDDEAFIAMDRLHSLFDNPLESAGDWVDFTRQMLQGLVFLHEHNITQVSYTFPSESGPQSIMMDIGLASPQSQFSRADFPVKYYLLDYGRAIKLRVKAPTGRSRHLRFPGTRGRSKATVSLTASRPRMRPVLSESFLGSLTVDTQAVNLTFTLAPERARSDSDVTLVSSGFNTPDSTSDMDTPKQSNFFSQSGPSARLSDSEGESGTDDAFPTEEVQTVRMVTPATRALLFAADLKNLARMLEDAVQGANSVSEALTPVFAAMRQAKTLSLSAEDALHMLEDAVRRLNLASVV